MAGAIYLSQSIAIRYPAHFPPASHTHTVLTDCLDETVVQEACLGLNRHWDSILGRSKCTTMRLSFTGFPCVNAFGPLHAA